MLTTVRYQTCLFSLMAYVRVNVLAIIIHLATIIINNQLSTIFKYDYQLSLQENQMLRLQVTFSIRVLKKIYSVRIVGLHYRHMSTFVHSNSIA